MKVQSLNGIWSYRVGKGAWSKKEVPFSAIPVGHSECERTFDVDKTYERAFVRFDGITYFARVFLNGGLLGEMLPYCEYTFEITDIAREKDNLLTVEIEDISPVFGPSEGWENYGGIIRDVSLIYRSETYIENVKFRTTLTNGYKDAEYSVETEKGGIQEGEYRITLSYDGETVDTYLQKTGEAPALRTVKNVRTWSPDFPSLYSLSVELYSCGRLLDTYTENVGFREFKCNRHRFVLNGEEIFLQGVCRHEMYGDYMHTVPREQVEKDLLLIKETGCNFVRLVHYPHNKAVLEIADRIGLMVSEEPGLWWSDTSVSEISSGSLEVLRRTVIRDRNHACIVFWLCFNECKFTEKYLVDAARVCRENDDTRLVSGANCMSNEETLKYYNICGFDFYTMHPYSRRIDRTVESACVLHDKPLMLTEWGGYYVYDNPHLITDFINTMYGLYRQNSDEGALAGASFWYWAEINDFGRGRPACEDGVLREALVDRYRNPTMIYRYFCDAWRNARIETTVESMYDYRALDVIEGTPLRCDDKPEPELLKEKAKSVMIPKLSNMRKREISVGPILLSEEVCGIARAPHLLYENKKLVFHGDGKQTDTVTVLGAVSLTKGYPIAGEYGEAAVHVLVKYTDGESESFTLRNGTDITTAFRSVGSSRIDPVAENASRFAEFSYEKNFENYVINRLDVKLCGKKEIESVTLSTAGNGYDVLIYGIFA